MGFLADTLASAPQAAWSWVADPINPYSDQSDPYAATTGHWLDVTSGQTRTGDQNSPPGPTAKNLGYTNESSLGLRGNVYQDAQGNYYNNGQKVNLSSAQIQGALGGAATASAQSKTAIEANRGITGAGGVGDLLAAGFLGGVVAPAAGLYGGSSAAGSGVTGANASGIAAGTDAAGTLGSGVSAATGGMAAPGALAGSGVTDEMLLTGQAADAGGTAAGDVSSGFSGMGSGLFGGGVPAAIDAAGNAISSGVGTGLGTAASAVGSALGSSGNSITDALSKMFPNMNLGNLASAGVNYASANSIADKYIQAAKDLQKSGNPLNDPQRQAYQTQFQNSINDPASWFAKDPALQGSLGTANTALAGSTNAANTALQGGLGASNQAYQNSLGTSNTALQGSLGTANSALQGGLSNAAGVTATAERAAQLGNPLQDPTRMPWNEQLKALEANPADFWNTNPVAQAQLNLAKNQFSAASGKSGAGGTQFSDYLKNVTNAASGTFNEQASLLSGLAGYNAANTSAANYSNTIAAGGQLAGNAYNTYGNNANSAYNTFGTNANNAANTLSNNSNSAYNAYGTNMGNAYNNFGTNTNNAYTNAGQQYNTNLNTLGNAAGFQLPAQGTNAAGTLMGQGVGAQNTANLGIGNLFGGQTATTGA